MTLDPENKRVIRIPSGYINAKDFYEGVRGLENRCMLIEAGIDEITPYDKFFITIAKHFYQQESFATGISNTPPDDVMDILNRLFGKSNE
jgi:hypothetical protein